MSKLKRVLIFDTFLPWDSGILVFMTINLSPFTKPTISSQAFEKNPQILYTTTLAKSANCEKLPNTQLYEHTLSKRGVKIQTDYHLLISYSYKVPSKTNGKKKNPT